MIQDREDQIPTLWALKVVEKPGILLARTFRSNFNMKNYCSREEKHFCEKIGIKCTTERVEYQGYLSGIQKTGNQVSCAGETAR